MKKAIRSWQRWAALSIFLTPLATRTLSRRGHKDWWSLGRRQKWRWIKIRRNGARWVAQKHSLCCRLSHIWYRLRIVGFIRRRANLLVIKYLIGNMRVRQKFRWIRVLARSTLRYVSSPVCSKLRTNKEVHMLSKVKATKLTSNKKALLKTYKHTPILSVTITTTAPNASTAKTCVTNWQSKSKKCDSFHSNLQR